ncbi:MAG: class I SAM-dependent methyltransferase [Oscillospiraceae bacterium]|nr:class I SAM-dependent methyltransferase [Oscillospiraceae bacterium]MCI1990267.1 class I SAM-dependent methyltransferase [Oscillospiraceae bacterium]MCI2035477.1 class I SAM-dependent methyltransferase [Oscillospiraceae bacterium]
MNIKWDAKKYTQDFSFVSRYGTDLTELIDTKGKPTVLDLGCGNGALTHKLTEEGMPALGMDASADLLQIAREKHPGLTFLEGDATNFTLPEPVDVVFSNAVFHWIGREKQPDLLECVYRSLKPNGQFIFEFGGHGNNALIHSALKVEFEKRGLVYHFPFYFPTIGEYSSLLEQAGFKVTYAVLFDRMTELKGKNGLTDWIQMFVKTPFGNLPETVHEEIIMEAVKKLRSKLFYDGKWHADYVRIRMKAVRE